MLYKGLTFFHRGLLKVKMLCNVHTVWWSCFSFVGGRNWVWRVWKRALTNLKYCCTLERTRNLPICWAPAVCLVLREGGYRKEKDQRLMRGRKDTWQGPGGNSNRVSVVKGEEEKPLRPRRKAWGSSCSLELAAPTWGSGRVAVSWGPAFRIQHWASGLRRFTPEELWILDLRKM